MIYITYNDLPSGIYYGQVIDVCLFLKKQLNINIRLVALVSIRGYWKHRKKIKTHLPNAIVIPMIPKHSNWKWNTLLLKAVLLKLGKQAAICRGIFATNMALTLKEQGWLSKVSFDARGAYKAEFSEYLNKVVQLTDSISDLEKKAVNDSDHCLAVSNKLIAYWKREYQYNGEKHAIIPCTLNSAIETMIPQDQIKNTKHKLGYDSKDIVLIYSGSNADWQSIKLVDAFLVKHLNKYNDLKIIFLSKFDLNELNAYKQFPERIRQEWLKIGEIHRYLSIADYGLLIREFSVTNEVSSPTKFAEYLNAGLKIIISPGIGDFSDFVQKHNAGIEYKNENDVLHLTSIDHTEKERLNALALLNFTKNNYVSEYKKITI